MKIMNVRDFDIPEFKRKKCGLWGMVRYFGVIRTVRYVYWCIREHKLKDKKWMENTERM